MRRMKTRQNRTRKLLLTLGVSACVAAQANPQGPSVAAGSVGFANPNATTLEITNSPNAIINWQAFDIGVGETTRFIQQGAASAVLNRVTTQNPSDILGNLVSNGRVFLVNPAGIVIGRDGLIDTAGLVLSTLNISNENFLAGHYEFNGDAGSGQITNHGYIKTTPGGEIVLLAPKILNAPEAGNDKSGIIESENGELVLAAGYAITITSLDDPDINFEVTAPAGEVVNLGRLIARGGSVEVLAETIRHSGEIDADALAVDASGRIVLTATKHIDTAATSVISARGERAADPATTDPTNPVGAAGGSVRITASAPAAEDGATVTPVPTTATIAGRIDVTGARGGTARVEADAVTVQATIDASGKTAGGTVQVLGDTVKAEGASVRANAEAGTGGDIRFGGEFRGADTLRAADSATIDGASRFEANATTRGDGGDVVVWSDLATVFAGKVEARGGLDAGDGGMIEVSGKETLQFSGGADVGAPRGDAGTLLLDPRNIVIVQGGATVSIDNPTPFAGDQFGSNFQVLANGNILVVNQNADVAGTVNAGEITLLSGSGSLLGVVAGASANQALGAFGFFTLNNNLILIRDPNAANGAATQAGALIAFDTGSGAVVGTTRGNSTGEQFGSNFAGSYTDSFIFSSTSADIGGIGADVGVVSIISRNTGLELGRVAGQSANEAFGSNIVALSGSTFLVQSALADVGAAIDAGTVVLVNASTGQQIGRVSGAASGDQFGGVVDTFNVPANTYLIRSALADVGGLTDNGTAVLVNRTTGLEIGRTSGLASDDKLGTFGPTLDGANYWLQVPEATVGGNANAGSLVLVNGATGQRLGSADGISANEFFSQNGLNFLNGNLVVVTSELADTVGGIDAGSVVAVNRTTGAVAGRVDGTSANENLGAFGIITRSNGNYFIPSPLFDTGGGVLNAGSVILADAATGNELGRFSGDTANEQFGSNRLDYSLANDDILVMAPTHGNGAGIVVQLSSTPISPSVINRGSGVQGAGPGDGIGAIAPVFLGSGNYVVAAPNYTVSGNAGAGAVFVIDDATGLNAFAPIEGLQSGEGLGATVDFNLFGFGADRFVIRESGHGFQSEGAIFFVDGADGGGVIRQLDGNTSDVLGTQPLFLTSNGNVIVGNPNALGNTGEVLLLDSANNFVTIGSVTGLSAGERLGDFSIGSVDTSARAAFGDFLIFSPQRTVGGKTNAGAVILASQTDLGGNVIFRADIEGAETDDFLGADAVVQNLADGDFVIFNPDADDPLGTPGGTNDEGAIILASAAGAELGRLYGQSDGERLGDEFQVFEALTGNGNFFITSPTADPGTVADAGSVYLVNGTNGALIGQADGDTANEGFGDSIDRFSLFATGDVLITSSAGHAGGGTIVQLASSDLGGGNIVRGRLDGVAGAGTAEGLGDYGTQMTAGGTRWFAVSPFADVGANPDTGSIYFVDAATGNLVSRVDGVSANENFGNFGVQTSTDGTHYFVRSPLADVGGNPDAGAIYFIDTATGTLANRLDGISANETFGDFGNTSLFSFGTNLFVTSELADVGAAADAGRVLVATQAGSVVGQLLGNHAGEQLGSSFQFVGSDIWVFAPLHDNGGLSAAGGIFSVANQNLGSGIVRASLLGGAAGDNLGAQGANFITGTTAFIRVPLADVDGITDAGSAILVNTGLQEIGRTSGTSANEQFSSQFFTSLANGNLVFRSALADVDGLVDAGVVKLVSRTTGTLIGQTAGTSAGEMFGSNGVQSLGNNGFLMVSEDADAGGLVDAGAVVQISADTGLEIQRIVGISANEHFGSFGSQQVGSRHVFGSPLADIGGITDAGRLVFFDPTSTNQGGTQSNVFFSTNANGDFVISTGAIANALNGGATLILESNNDILLDFGADLTASAGTLVLRAGRSVIIKGLLNLPDTDIEITVGADQPGIDLQQRGSGPSEFAMFDPQLVGKNVSITADLVTLTGGSTSSDTAPLAWEPIDAISFFEDFRLNGTDYPATFVLGLESLTVTADTIALHGGDAPGAFAALVSFGAFDVTANGISLVPGTEPGSHAVFLGLGGQGNFDFDSCDGCGSTFLFTDPFLAAGAPVSGFFVTGLVQNLAIDSILAMLDRDDDDSEDEKKKRCN